MHKYSDDYKNRMSIKGNIVVCDTGPKAQQYAVILLVVVVVVLLVVVLVVVQTRVQFKFERVCFSNKATSDQKQRINTFIMATHNNNNYNFDIGTPQIKSIKNM